MLRSALREREQKARRAVVSLLINEVRKGKERGRGKESNGGKDKGKGKKGKGKPKGKRAAEFTDEVMGEHGGEWAEETHESEGAEGWWQ